MLLDLTDRLGFLVIDEIFGSWELKKKPLDFHLIFSLEGPGEIVANDKGDAANLVSFVSPVRTAFSGKCLVIGRAKKGLNRCDNSGC